MTFMSRHSNIPVWKAVELKRPKILFETDDYQIIKWDIDYL